MNVIKRDGTEAELDFSKLKKAIHFATDGIDSCDPVELMEEVITQLRNGITTRELQQTLIRVAVEKTSVENPSWQFVAARLMLYDLYKEAALNRHYDASEQKYGNFYEQVWASTAEGLYGDYLLEHYTSEEIDEAGTWIKPERDLLFNYVGLKQLFDRYLVKGPNGEVLELPQERFLIVALHLAMKEKDKMYWAKRFYDVLSTLKATVATPTLANAGTPHHQLSSCFIDTVDDNLWSIYNTDAAFSQVSKHGGGITVTSAFMW